MPYQERNDMPAWDTPAPAVEGFAAMAAAWGDTPAIVAVHTSCGASVALSVAAVPEEKVRSRWLRREEYRYE